MTKNNPTPSYSSFKQAVTVSTNIGEVAIHLGLTRSGHSYTKVKAWSELYGIPLPKYDYANHPWGTAKIPDSDVFVIDSTYTDRSKIKRRLLDLGWLYRCSIPECPVVDTWLGKPVTLHLDHINGVPNDNRLENLRFLCPACHTQTSTYAGRNVKRTVRKEIPIQRPTKIMWPAEERLRILVKRHGYRKTGEILGVSDNAVRKHLSKLTG